MLCPLLTITAQPTTPDQPKLLMPCLTTDCAWWASDRCIVQLIAWRLGNLVEVTAGNKQNGT